ncbi:hypothetical protein D9M69_696470 [compost metagenome]
MENTSIDTLSQEIAMLLNGTKLQLALLALSNAEQEVHRTSIELKRIKKSLDKVMHE